MPEISLTFAHLLRGSGHKDGPKMVPKFFEPRIENLIC
jgi:hypothetical protein